MTIYVNTITEEIVIDEDDGDIVSIIEEVDEVFETQEGAQGQPGPAGGVTFTLIAGEDLGGHRIVVVNDSGQAIYADPSNTDHAFRLAGMTTGAVSSAGAATIQGAGEIIEPSWSWTPGIPVFLGPNGTLTQTAPTTGLSIIVAIVLASNKLRLDLYPAIEL